MGIQSTKRVTRKTAIYRIRLIYSTITEKDYRKLESLTLEPDHDIKEFIDNNLSINIEHIDKWTNEMLEELMDCPFFRHSMFDNYQVVDTLA